MFFHLVHVDLICEKNSCDFLMSIMNYEKKGNVYEYNDSKIA